MAKKEKVKGTSKDTLLYIAALLFLAAMFVNPSILRLSAMFSISHMGCLVMSGRVARTGSKTVAHLIALVGIGALVLSCVYAYMALTSDLRTTLSTTVNITSVILLIAPYIGVKFTMKRS